MHIGDAFSSSFGELARAKMRTFLTMLGVIIGVGAIIILTSLGEGMRVFVKKMMTSMGTNLLIINPGKTQTEGEGVPINGMQTKERLTNEDAAYLRRMLRGQVLGVTTQVVGSTEIASGHRSRNAVVVGCSAEYTTAVDFTVALGSFFTQGDEDNSRRVVCIGANVADAFFKRETPLGQFIRLGNSKFRVVGVMSRKGRFLGIDVDSMVFIPVTAAMRFFKTDRVQELDVRVKDGADAERMLERLRKLLIERHGEDDFSAMTQASMLKTVDEIMNGLTYVLGAIAFISLVVGGIGIMNIMLVSVKERTREIGIRKSIGARRRDILFQFLVEATIISIVGGVIGIGLAAGFLYLVHAFYPAIPFILPAFAVVIGFGFAMIVGLTAGVYPAWSAAGVNVVEALRAL